jgi:hypothetical protein
MKVSRWPSSTGAATAAAAVASSTARIANGPTSSRLHFTLVPIAVVVVVAGKGHDE